MIHAYTIRIFINKYKILLIQSFSIPNAETALKEYYHRKFSKLQRNINSYKVIPLGEFRPESDYYLLATEAIENAEIYS